MRNTKLRLVAERFMEHEDSQDQADAPEFDKAIWMILFGVCALCLVGLSSFAYSQQRKINHLQNIVESVEKAKMERLLQASLLRKMCKEMGGYENLPGGKWFLYKPYEHMPGQDDIVICLQGNELQNAIPPIVPTN